MGDTDAHVRYQPVQDVVDGRQFLHFVVQEENLSAPVQFVIDDALDFLLVEQDDLRLDGNPVRRRSIDDGQVAGAEERELKGPGNRGRRQGKGIDRCLEVAEFLLRAHTELLFFVDDQQAQILEFKPGPEDFVRPDQNVYLPFFQLLLDIGNLLRRPEAAHIFHLAGKVFQTRLESFKMLQGENRRGHEDGDLLGIADGLEGGPDGHFRLSEAHVAAHQAVHRAIVLHVLLDRLVRLFLIRRILVHEGGFQFFLEISVRREGVSLRGLPAGVKLDQFLGNVLHAGLGR